MAVVIVICINRIQVNRSHIVVLYIAGTVNLRILLLLETRVVQADKDYIKWLKNDGLQIIRRMDKYEIPLEYFYKINSSGKILKI